MLRNIIIGNTHIVNNVEELDFSKLVPGNQIMVFEDEHEYEEVGIKMDYTTHMILNNITSNYIYNFLTIKVIPSLGFEEIHIPMENVEDDYEIEYKVDGADFDRVKELERTYLYFPEGKIFPISIDNERSYRSCIEQINFDMQYDITGCKDESEINCIKFNYSKNEILKRIHYWVFGISSNNFDNCSSFTESGKIIFYYSYPLDGNTAVILKIEHNIDIEGFSWNKEEHVMIMDREGNVLHLECEFNDLFHFVHELKEHKIYGDDYWKKFDHIYECSNYDINEHLRCEGRKLGMVYNLFSENSAYGSSVVGLENFYKPFYENSELNYQAYKSTVFETFSPGWFEMYQGKSIHYFRFDNPEEKQKIENESRIAKQYYGFCRGKGFNPKDGLFYKGKGKLDEENNSRILYTDHEGIIIKSTGWNESESYYIRIGDYYVMSNLNKDEDKQKVQELKERRELAKKLSEGHQLTAV